MLRLLLLAGVVMLVPALLSGSQSADYALPYEEVVSGGGCSSSSNYEIIAEVELLDVGSPVSSADYGITPSLPQIDQTSVEVWIEIY